MTEDFLAEKYDEIHVAYSTFITTLTQRPEITQLLPITSPEQAEGHAASNDEYLFEPSPEAVLRRLLPHFVAVDLYRAVLENQASEQSARMIAMRNSTDNANELIDDLDPRLQQDAAGHHHPRDDRDRLRGRSPGRLTAEENGQHRWRPERSSRSRAP